MRYRYIASIILLFATAVTTVAQQLSDKYTKQRPVVIVCDWDKPPYEFLNDKGEPAGSNIDVMNAVMRELGLPCKFVMKEWSVALKTFERGDADLILAKARRHCTEKHTVLPIRSYHAKIQRNNACA